MVADNFLELKHPQPENIPENVGVENVFKTLAENIPKNVSFLDRFEVLWHKS